MEIVGKIALADELRKRAQSQAIELTKTDATNILNTFFNMIEDNVAAGKVVKITGFGKFSATHRSERMGRNPQTGETMKISAHTTPVFKPGKIFKEAVN